MRILAAASPAPGPRLTPPSTRFHTLVGQPRTIALAYANGKQVRSRLSGEDQMMYTLTSGEKAYFPLNVAQAIDSLTLAPGQPFTICNRGAGTWDVDRVYEPAPAAVPARAPSAGPAAPTPPSLTPPGSSASDHRNSDGNILASFYPDAIEIALAGVALAKGKGLLLAPTFEDVRCIATTLYISHTGGRS